MAALQGKENATELELYSQVFLKPVSSTKILRSKKAFALCGFPGRKGTEQSFTFFYISPIYSICSYSNPNRGWVAGEAFVSIETICSIREKVYLVAHEI